jgi:hypothetical protein
MTVALEKRMAAGAAGENNRLKNTTGLIRRAARKAPSRNDAIEQETTEGTECF